MKKAIISFLCALFVFFAFSSCMEKTDPESHAETGAGETAVYTEPATDSQSAVTEAVDTDTPEIIGEYSGKTLKILVNDGFWPGDDIYRDTDKNDPLSEAIRKRNQAVKEKYGIDFEVIKDAAAVTTLKTAAKSGYNVCGAAYINAFEACPAACENIFRDLTAIKNLDLKKQYWDQGLYNGLQIDGKLFYATGDISTKANDGTFLLLYNKDLVKDDLYTTVNDGEWTLDTLNSIIKDKYSDLNNNGESDPDDFFGMGIQIEAYLGFFFGANCRLTIRDDDQMPRFYLESDADTLYNNSVFEKVHELTRSGKNVIDSHDYLAVAPYYTEGTFASVKAFRENRSLFCFTYAAMIPEITGMKSDYGILPLPKYNRDQASYLTYVYHGADMFVIPLTNKNPDFAGYALEVLCAESYNTVTPVYFEQTVKNLRDGESRRMIDMIFKNRVWDLCYYARLGSADDMILQQIKKPDYNQFDKFIKNIRKPVAKAIQKYIDAYKATSHLTD